MVRIKDSLQTILQQKITQLPYKNHLGNVGRVLLIGTLKIEGRLSIQLQNLAQPWIPEEDSLTWRWQSATTKVTSAVLQSGQARGTAPNGERCLCQTR